MIEFKGPNDYPEEFDFDLLMHVGSGVFCRLNDQRREAGERGIRHGQFALWYIVPRIGETFWEHARQRVDWEPEGSGLWRSRAWQYPLFMLDYSGLDTRVVDALPLSVFRADLGPSPTTIDVLIQNIELFKKYRQLLARFQPQLWEALKAMQIDPSIINWPEVARVTAQDLDKIVPHLPMEQVVAALGEDKVIETLGQERLLQKLLAGKSPEEILDIVRKAQGETG